ncbi:MAG TPA: outer membrane protein transport protein [Anaeromyxobacteraceae bacterium]|nr:outer membrane protein transport protein [Anaeromyxobacteraceae bacterium]
MNRHMKSLLAAAIAATASPALATNGMRMIGFGANQVSMGGASAALPLDAASIITNPAAIVALGGRLDFGASYFNPTVKYQAQEVPGLPQPGMAVGSTASFQSQRGASPVPAFGLVVPVDDRLSFGIGAYGIAGMGVDFAQNLYGGVTYSSYSQMRFAPGVAYRLTDWLAAGATVNVMYAQMGYDAAEGLLQVSHLGDSAFGIGGTFGLYAQVMKGLTVGAAYETKSVFQDFKFNVPAHQPLDPSTGRPAVDAGGNPIILPASVDRIQFNQPSTFTAGAAWNVLPALTLAFDAQFIRWTESNGLNLPAYNSDLSQTGAMPFNLNWSDQWVFKVGAQLRATKTLALRAGYNYGKMPLDSSRAFENIAFPAVAEHHVTAGIGYDVTSRVSIAVAGMWVPEAKLQGSNAQGQFIQSYQATMSQFALDMSIGYRL